jgi:aquaporin Z
MTRKFLSEVLGTFGLVFTGCGAVIVNDLTGGAVGHLGICTVFGLVVMTMVYSFGDVSGAHINPAVTIAFWLSGRFPLKEVGPYILAQCIGSVAACAILWYLFPDDGSFLGATLVSGTIMQSFLLEVVITFLLMLIIIMVATGPKEVGTLAGIAIGAAVALLALVGGPISGASMNPARSLGPALISGNLQDFWVFVLAPIIGAALAVPVSTYIKGPKTI